MNLDNIKDLFCLFMNHLSLLSRELARLAILISTWRVSKRAGYLRALDIACCKICNKQLNQRVERAF